MPAKSTFPIGWLWIFLIGTALILGVVRLWGIPANLQFPPTQPADQPNIVTGPGYEAVRPDQFQVSILAENLKAPTRIKITPDGKYLLATQLTGEVMAWHREGEQWIRLPGNAVTIDTGFPGFPPEEGGLAGLVFSADYSNNHQVFFLHSSRTAEGKVRNRVSAASLRETDAGITFNPPVVLYEADFDGSASHQITDGLGLMIADKPHLILLVGEGFKASRATDPAVDGGKIILIQEDGSLPLGERPYPENPRVQALGLRNAFVITPNPFDPSGRVLIADTGPDKYDRLIYTRLVNPGGKPLDLGWNGNQEDLAKPIPDPNFPSVQDIVIHRLEETRTITGLAVHPGKGPIPASSGQGQSLLLTLFGKTGSLENDPGKKIFLGRLTRLDGQPELSLEVIIQRTPEASGQVGNPIGLEIDPLTGDFFFADIMEGRIYQVKVRGGTP